MNRVIYTQEHKNLVKKLIKARLEAGLRQEDIAKQMNVTQSYISKLESGQRKIDLVTLKKISTKYNKDLSYFL